MTAVHPYEVLAGGPTYQFNNTVIPRPEWMVYSDERARFYNVKTRGASSRCHRIYYCRAWGGSSQERLLSEEPPAVGPDSIKVIMIQGLAGTHVQWQVRLCSLFVGLICRPDCRPSTKR